jgi:hypothetical protein
MPEDRIVMCMKWGTLYPAEYVNVLFNACHAHLMDDFRFVCLTDDARGLAPGIEALPIPEIGCTPAMWRHGAWPKLGVFSTDLYGLRGRALFIDLDTVICGSLDAFLATPGRLIVLDGGENWRPGSNGRAAPLVATGIFAFSLGSLGHIVTEFQRDPEGHFLRYDLEQAFVGAMVPEITFWPRPWVLSFKRHLRQPVGVDRLRPPRRPPADARVIAFHGEPRPIALVRNSQWARFPRAGRGPVDWVRDYWLTYGGRAESGDGLAE